MGPSWENGGCSLSLFSQPGRRNRPPPVAGVGAFGGDSRRRVVGEEGEEAAEGFAELSHPLLAELFRQLFLDPAEEGESLEDASLACGGEAYPLGTPIEGIGDSLHVALGFQIVHELAHGLFARSDPGSQLGQLDALAADVGQEVGVGRAQGGILPAQALDGAFVPEPRGLQQELPDALVLGLLQITLVGSIPVFSVRHEKG